MATVLPAPPSIAPTTAMGPDAPVPTAFAAVFIIVEFAILIGVGPSIILYVPPGSS